MHMVVHQAIAKEPKPTLFFCIMQTFLEMFKILVGFKNMLLVYPAQYCMVYADCALDSFLSRYIGIVRCLARRHNTKRTVSGVFPKLCSKREQVVHSQVGLSKIILTSKKFMIDDPHILFNLPDNHDNFTIFGQLTWFPP